MLKKKKTHVFTTKLKRYFRLIIASSNCFFFSGILNVLGDFIDNVDDRTQFAILCAIRNLSDAAANESSLGPLIINLIHIVATGEESTTACAAGILSNLTCNNIRNKQTLCFNRSVHFAVITM